MTWQKMEATGEWRCAPFSISGTRGAYTLSVAATGRVIARVRLVRQAKALAQAISGIWGQGNEWPTGARELELFWTIEAFELAVERERWPEFGGDAAASHIRARLVETYALHLDAVRWRGLEIESRREAGGGTASLKTSQAFDLESLSLLEGLGEAYGVALGSRGPLPLETTSLGVKASPPKFGRASHEKRERH